MYEYLKQTSKACVASGKSISTIAKARIRLCLRHHGNIGNGNNGKTPIYGTRGVCLFLNILNACAYKQMHTHTRNHRLYMHAAAQSEKHESSKSVVSLSTNTNTTHTSECMYLCVCVCVKLFYGYMYAATVV